MEKQTEHITINEFKMWLMGVEEMQDDGWCPTPQQWAKIRNRIDMLADDVRPPVGPVNRVPVDNRALATLPQTSALAGVTPPSRPPLQYTPERFAGPAPDLVRTPDIDTTVAPYESSFA